LDADRHGGPDGVQALHELIGNHGLPDGVPRVSTPSGGEHYFFRNLHDEPLGNSEGTLPPGINVRGCGGFIMAPGATLPSGLGWREIDDGPSLTTSYQSGTIPEISTWIVDLIRPKRRAALPVGAKDVAEPSLSRKQAYAEQALRNASRDLATTEVGSRDNALIKLSYCLGPMVAAGWISADRVRLALFEAAVECRLLGEIGEPAVLDKIDRGLSAGSQFPPPTLQDRHYGTFGTFGTVSQEPGQREWGEPDLSYLGSGRSAPPIFPLDILGPSWGPWCLKHAAARSVPVDYVAAGLLAAGSILIGNARWAAASPEWREPPVLWLGVVGAPAQEKVPRWTQPRRCCEFSSRRR
jgi:hypothetical protein